MKRQRVQVGRGSRIWKCPGSSDSAKPANGKILTIFLNWYFHSHFKGTIQIGIAQMKPPTKKCLGGGIAVAVNPAQNFILDDVSSWCGCSGEQSGEKAFHTGCRRGCGRLTTFSASPNSHSVSSILFTSPTSPNQTTKVQKVQTCLNKSTESTEEIWKTLPTRLHNLWSFYETKMQHGPSIKVVNWDSFVYK